MNPLLKRESFLQVGFRTSLLKGTTASRLLTNTYLETCSGVREHCILDRPLQQTQAQRHLKGTQEYIQYFSVYVRMYVYITA
jgi:hypothetical protein